MTKVLTGIKVSAPATVANLNCGTDSLAIALKSPADEIIIYKFGPAGIRIRSISGDKKKLSTKIVENTAGLAALSVWRFLVEKHGVDSDIGIELEIRKKIPVDSGLGSNEALAVAGGMAVNEFFGGLLTKRELLPLLAAAEYGVLGAVSLPCLAASLLGSCMLVRDADSCDIHRITLPRGLYFAMISPQVNIIEQIPAQVSIQAATKQAGNLAALILGFNNTDFNLISRAMEDSIMEHHISGSIPYFEELKTVAKIYGALSFGIADKGPTLFAFCNSSVKAEESLSAMESIYSSNKIKYNAWFSAVNMEGAELS